MCPCLIVTQNTDKYNKNRPENRPVPNLEEITPLEEKRF